jgi:hypothetical protein
MRVQWEGVRWVGADGRKPLQPAAVAPIVSCARNGFLTLTIYVVPAPNMSAEAPAAVPLLPLAYRLTFCCWMSPPTIWT